MNTYRKVRVGAAVLQSLMRMLRAGLDVLQEMMQVMVSERGGRLYSIDERYCIDNGAMIAWPGLLAFKNGQVTPFEETTCTQRFRTDDVLVTWRD